MQEKPRKLRINGDRASYFLITLPAFLLYSFFYVYSVILGFSHSLTDWDGLSRKYGYIGFENYLKIFDSKKYWESIGITIRYALCIVLLTIVVGVTLAVVLNSLKRFKTFVKSVFFFPTMISAVAVALIWDQMFYRAWPTIGGMLGFENVTSPLSNPVTAFMSVVFVNMWQAICIPTVIFMAGLQSIPSELYESAVIDGATRPQQFRYITLPHLMPMITVNGVMALKSGITAFDYAFAMTGGGPARATMLIGIKIYDDAFQASRYSRACAEAVTLFVIIAVLSAIQTKLSSGSGVND